MEELSVLRKYIYVSIIEVFIVIERNLFFMWWFWFLVGNFFSIWLVVKKEKWKLLDDKEILINR